MMYGYVDRVDDHVIATKFDFWLIPVSSMYVTGERVEVFAYATRRTWSGVPIRLDYKSVALAYPRIWLWVLALAWPFFTHHGRAFSSMTWKDWMPSLAMVVAAILANFLGRLPEREKRRLRVLGSVTGMNLDPSKLTHRTRADRREALEAAMTEADLPVTPEGCAAAAATVPPEALPLIYAFTRYSGDEPEWRAASAAALARIEAA